MKIDFYSHGRRILRFCNHTFKFIISGFSAGLLDDSDIFKWEVLIIGPPGLLKHIFLGSIRKKNHFSHTSFPRLFFAYIHTHNILRSLSLSFRLDTLYEGGFFKGNIRNLLINCNQLYEHLYSSPQLSERISIETSSHAICN